MDVWKGETAYVYGTVGKVIAKEDIDKVKILDYTVESMIYGNYSMYSTRKILEE